jgi:hypothetical protein
MISEGWRSIVGKEWAGCVLHNLPFLCHDFQEKIHPLKSVRSVISIHGSAADWNYYDFMEQADQRSLGCKAPR